MNSSEANHRPVILELVGPAGAGKTTIRKTLLKNLPQVDYQAHPYFRDPKYTSFFIANTIKMVPLLVRVSLANKGRLLTLQEIALMVVMNGWSPELKRRAVTQNGFILLDQGPVYLLAHLDTMGPPRLHTPAGNAWLERGYKVWSDTVNAIVYLDTDDGTLIKRINTRGKEHGIRGKPAEEAQKFLIRSRESLNNAICGLTERNRDLRVYRFNTSEKTADEICHEVVNIVNHSL